MSIDKRRILIKRYNVACKIQGIPQIEDNWAGSIERLESLIKRLDKRTVKEAEKKIKAGCPIRGRVHLSKWCELIKYDSRVMRRKLRASGVQKPYIWDYKNLPEALKSKVDRLL